MSPRGGFRLRKWYLDVVSEAGEVAIAHHARLSAAGLAATYVGLLTCTAEGIRQRSRLGRASPPRPGQEPEPTRRGADLSWECPPLGISLRAGSTCPGVADTLLQGPGGSVVWRCHQPLSRVALSGPLCLAGLGYVEELELSLPPWSLPIDTLRWGRFGSTSGAGLCWIEWQGPAPKRLALLVSETACERVTLDGVDEATVAFPGGRLELSEGLVLREAALGGLLPEGALAERLRRFFPSSLLAAREVRWRSRGVLSVGGRSLSGWAIHERVVLR